MYVFIYLLEVMFVVSYIVGWYKKSVRNIDIDNYVKMWEVFL